MTGLLESTGPGRTTVDADDSVARCAETTEGAAVSATAAATHSAEFLQFMDTTTASNYDGIGVGAYAGPGSGASASMGRHDADRDVRVRHSHAVHTKRQTRTACVIRRSWFPTGLRALLALRGRLVLGRGLRAQ